MLPPCPPSPPDGPPLGTYFSRRNATQPFPPSPPLTNIFASSTNTALFTFQPAGDCGTAQYPQTSIPPQGSLSAPLVARALFRIASCGPQIGIGEVVAHSPLPHHRTCGSAYGGSANIAKSVRPAAEAQAEQSRRSAKQCSERESCDPPGAVGTAGRLCRQIPADTPFAKLAEPCSSTLPLLPHHRPKPAA